MTAIRHPGKPGIRKDDPGSPAKGETSGATTRPVVAPPGPTDSTASETIHFNRNPGTAKCHVAPLPCHAALCCEGYRRESGLYGGFGTIIDSNYS